MVQSIGFLALALVIATSPVTAQTAAAQKMAAQTTAAPLPEEPLFNVITLPEEYPASWILVHDFHFNSLVDGRVAIVDTQDPKLPLKGLVRAAQFANMLHAPAKHEIYTAETFYSRLTRGERTDAITIWDTATLQPKGEIVLPGGKRLLSVTYSGTFQFTNGDRWALVSNFTPAQSVTVVDLDERKVLGEIDLPGCAHIYPSGTRGFSSFCSDGSLISMQLDDMGAVAASTIVSNAHDIDNQPLFAMPAMVGKTAWFVSYHGELMAVDLSGPVARPIAAKASTGNAEGGAPEWRPGGWQVIASDADGLLYVLMSPNGREGSHKDGGTEVWVVDPVANKRLRRIDLDGVGGSITVTHEPTPHLIVARPDGQIDVFDASSGKLVHKLGATAAFNPILLAPAR